jgi:alcohol dehydrogenase
MKAGHCEAILRDRLRRSPTSFASPRGKLFWFPGTRHILKGEYPVKAGLVIGPEPVGVIHELGVGVTGYAVSERVLVGAITKFGNTIDGAQAEYLLVPNAQANLAKIPDDLSDEQVVLLADIASTGISATESGDVKLGDTVAVFAQGPIGL